MKLKELIAVLEDTDFETSAPVYKGTSIINQKDMNFKLNTFGWSAWGGTKENAIIIKFKDEKLEFSNYHFIKSNEELMDREVRNIEKLLLNPHINTSSSGNEYWDMSCCQLIIVVE